MKQEESNLQLNLFTPLTRTERQKEALRNWINNKCIGTFVFPTGFGKTRVTLTGIKALLALKPDTKIIVIVPSEGLQKQWISKLDEMGLSLNCEVLIINTAIKTNRECDLLVLDEAHHYVSGEFSQVFTKIKNKYRLALSATIDRLDGKEEILKKYCPVIDVITPLEAIANGWMAESVEYEIILNVDDINVYNEITSEFNKHFEFFGYDFNTAMHCIGKDGFTFRKQLAGAMCKQHGSTEYGETLKLITYHATSFNRCLQSRKKFINTHPKKIELTKEILKYRQDKKIITFSANISIAEQLGENVYSSKQSKKKNRMTLEEFAKMEAGQLHTVAAANEGLDVPGLQVAVILGQDSSPIKYQQRLGRVSRKEGDKIAEIFTFVINETVESKWFDTSHKNSSNIIKVDEENLLKLLKGEEYKTYKRPVKNFTFRF